MIHILRKLAPLFILGGIILALLGTSVAYVEGGFNAMSKSVLAAGLAIAAVSLGLLNFKLLARKLRLSQNLRLCAYLTFLVLVLISVNMIGVANDQRFDFTKSKQHTLSTITKDVLGKLQKNVQITVFYVGLPPKYLEDLLEEYTRLAPSHIKIEIINPLEQLGYASKFETTITGDEKKAIVQSDKERADIDFKKEPLSEESLTNAIIHVTRDKRRIYFLAGHSEYSINNEGPNDLSIFAQLLKRNNAALKNLILKDKDRVPADCDLLIIAGPKNPIPKKELGLIDDYLRQGGKAFILTESAPRGDEAHPLSAEDKTKNPALNRLLNRWGLVVGDDVVVDLQNHVGQDVGIPATHNYPPHKEIVANLDYTFYIRPRSITLAKNFRDTIKVAPLVLTESQANSWGETDPSLVVKFDEGKDVPGPVSIGAVIWEPKNKTKNSDTRLIVFTDTDFISNNFIMDYSNAALALNAVKWLTQLNNMVTIEKPKQEIAKLNLTSMQEKIIVIILYAMPLLIAVCGCLVWWKQSIVRDS